MILLNKVFQQDMLLLFQISVNCCGNCPILSQFLPMNWFLRAQLVSYKFPISTIRCVECLKRVVLMRSVPSLETSPHLLVWPIAFDSLKLCARMSSRPCDHTKMVLAVPSKRNW
ncbi:Putative homeodomain-like transcription factor superfamily protein [Zea mays]|uniref:Putative homeodomain-like transcription factor superfamily protein n=1 Tax=Zea mays TaxID=4577 RepID=A0A1D6NTS4_MAIZE|nr:Putative homeodomain-like transcription factor superfamily protein [Zea mays]